MMVVDTSEAYSSDNMPGPNLGSSNSEHSQGGGQTAQEQDSYFKIKMHAMSCLQTLFKANNKSFNINTLWHPIFPSFLIQPRADIVTPATLASTMTDRASRE